MRSSRRIGDQAHGKKVELIGVGGVEQLKVVDCVDEEPEGNEIRVRQLAAESAVPIVPFADYHLRGRSDLIFATGKIEPCLQAADILAGCAMRFARDGRARKGRVDVELRAAFEQMIDAGNPIQATGINLLMSTRLLETLGVPHIPADIADRMFPWA